MWHYFCHLLWDCDDQQCPLASLSDCRCRKSNDQVCSQCVNWSKKESKCLPRLPRRPKQARSSHLIFEKWNHYGRWNVWRKNGNTSTFLFFFSWPNNWDQLSVVDINFSEGAWDPCMTSRHVQSVSQGFSWHVWRLKTHRGFLWCVTTCHLSVPHYIVFTRHVTRQMLSTVQNFGSVEPKVVWLQGKRFSQ